jgi:hypothetical protein
MAGEGDLTCNACGRAVKRRRPLRGLTTPNGLLIAPAGANSVVSVRIDCTPTSVKPQQNI